MSQCKVTHCTGRVLANTRPYQGDWETGRLGDWETGRLGDWETGRLGDWETGRLGDWETGRLGDWEIGRLGDWECYKTQACWTHYSACYTCAGSGHILQFSVVSEIRG